MCRLLQSLMQCTDCTSPEYQHLFFLKKLIYDDYVVFHTYHSNHFMSVTTPMYCTYCRKLCGVSRCYNLLFWDINHCLSKQ